MWLIRGTAAAVALVFIGYVSGSMAARRCEDAIAHRIVTDLVVSEAFVLAELSSLPDHYRGSEAILRRIGVKTRLCTPPSMLDGACFPWVGVSRAKWVNPFVFEIEWGYAEAPLAGYGSRTRFVVVFGLVVSERKGPSWIS